MFICKIRPKPISPGNAKHRNKLEWPNVCFVTGQWAYTCKICGTGLGSRARLKQHMDCHSGVKKFVCEKCAKPFKKQFDLVSFFYFCFVLCCYILESGVRLWRSGPLLVDEQIRIAHLARSS